MIEVTAIDHIYLAVSDFTRSEAFYDRVMRALGFYKSDFVIAGEEHAHYFNRSLQISIRPARSSAPHDSYAPGLHHLCLQVATNAVVDEVSRTLSDLGVSTSEPRLYPEYAPDYYATFFSDPDGIRFEVVARRSGREQIVRDWDEFDTFLNPLRAVQAKRSG